MNPEKERDPDFDQTIGQLDFVLSKLMIYARSIRDGMLSEPNKQTLKHHAEDMDAASKAIFKLLGREQEGTPQPDRVPIKILLYCPRCGNQHIDRPEPEAGWTNPPHTSHLCAVCYCIWRPADVPTYGVEDGQIQTRGKDDTWPEVKS